MSTLYSAATRRARGDGGLCGSEDPERTGGSGPVCVTTCDDCCDLDSTEEILFVEAAPLEEAGLFSFTDPLPLRHRSHRLSLRPLLLLQAPHRPQRCLQPA